MRVCMRGGVIRYFPPATDRELCHRELEGLPDPDAVRHGNLDELAARRGDLARGASVIKC